MSTKICKNCNQEKDLSEFNKNKNICRECDNERIRKYRKKNKEKIKVLVHEKYLQDPLKKILQSHKSICKKKNIPFSGYDVLYEHLKPIFDRGECEYCGKKFTPGNETLRNDSPSLDRLISENGYIVGNIAILCHDCNRRKQDISVEEMRKLINWVENKIKENYAKYNVGG